MTPRLFGQSDNALSVIGETVSLRAQSRQAIRHAGALRAALNDLVDERRLAQRRAEAAPVQTDASASARHRAEAVIDCHGRWASRTAYRRLAESVCADDPAGETYWSGVIVSLGEMRKRPAPGGPSVRLNPTRSVAARLVVACLAAGPACAGASAAGAIRMHGPEGAARAVLAAERAFEARAEATGPAEAMREYMDPVDGLSFAGGEPARGAAAIYAAHGGSHPGGKLSWTPSEVFASQAGDMGAVWGHFRFKPPGQKEAVVTGKYVTVWRRTDGAWKGIIDIGTPD